ncbi:MAG TPA: response regulator [Chthoniobacterales bacterium]|jgi:FixJ family two-component response regulator|nr:response regulator [Chthoniobacterales bacterium]
MSAETMCAESIYVLDDDPSVLKSLARLLAAAGFQFRTFSEPDNLLASIEGRSVPVVILDVWMEKMTGLEVQSKLSHLSPRTRVIVMTGRNDPGVRRTAMDRGAFAFFVKPFDDEEFVAAIRASLAAAEKIG